MLFFYGGEPLLNQKWIKEFIELSKVDNLTFTLQTNGTLLNKIDDFILENLNFIYISIDGDQKTTDKFRGNGTYNVVLDNIKKIKPKFKGKLLARMTIIPESPLFNSVTHLVNLGVFDYIYWQLENSPSKVDYLRVKENYKKEIRKLADFWVKNLTAGKALQIIPFCSVVLSILSKEPAQSYKCGAGTYLITIDSDGNCYSCDELLKEKFKIGATNTGIQQKQLPRSDFCLNCDINEICGGRCFKALSSFPTEKFRFYCDMTKISVEEIQSKIPQIKLLVRDGKISADDLKCECFTEEIP
ncbi:MAG: radical SAM protein [archaeon]